MFLAVAIGAFGAHGLKSRVPADMLVVFETGVRYHVYHALALFLVAWLAEKNISPTINYAGWAFAVGIFLFSGSLYALVLTGVRALGAITPLGGLSFLIGWAIVGFSYLKKA